MKHSLIIALALAAGTVHAAGFAPLRLADSGETCYSWEGGHKSAGSFSKCNPAVEVVVLQPMPPPPVVAAAPLPAPMMSCPPIAEPVPRKPIVRKPRPKVICKPA
jgi:hypothetical protein